MEKLQNETLQKFLDNFIEELKRENSDRKYRGIEELDIPFIISSLYQSFNNDTDRYKDFISDLEDWSDYGINIEDSSDYGIINVYINLMKYEGRSIGIDFEGYDMPNYDYKFCFSYEERNWGYCECTPDMKDYREDKHCCGHGCDASFCAFTLYKIIHTISGSWTGDEHDYWDFEEEFYLNDKELADKKAAEEKARMIKELKARIESDTKKLAELEK